MTRQERLRRCYFNEELDRPAVYTRTGFPANDPTYDRLKAYLLEHSDLKESWTAISLDATPWIYRFLSPPGFKGEGIETAYPTEFRTESYSEYFERQIVILHTPRGDLACSSLANLQGMPGIEETFLLKNREDAETYLSLPPPVYERDTSGFFAMKDEIGEKGIVHVNLGVNPGGIVARLFGTEAFALASVNDRDILHALCERQMNIIIDRLKYLLGRGVGPFFCIEGQEFITPPLHGPVDFYDFNVKYDSPIFDQIHDAGGRIHVHCHGSIKQVFQGLLDAGVDVLHPFEAPPMGDITAAEAKTRARDRLCLEGNIQVHRMYEASPEEMRQETEELIRVAFDDHKGLIVCPSASPYIYGEGEVCFPVFKAMIDTAVG